MGVAGAALATVFGQGVAAGLALWFNIKKNKEIKLSIRKFKWSGKVVKGIYAVGVPSIIMASVGSVMTFGMNKILIAFSSTANAVFGVYFKMQSFIFMPVFGLNNGMVPIIAYNYGAKKSERINKTIRLSIIGAVAIMLVGFGVFQIVPSMLLDIFNASDYMKEIGIPALRIISLSFLFAGFSIVASSVFQALSHGILSLLVSVIRQLIVLLPCAFILAKIGGLHAIWFSFPVAEIVAFVLSIFFLRYVKRKEIAPLSDKGVKIDK